MDTSQPISAGLSARQASVGTIRGTPHPLTSNPVTTPPNPLRVLHIYRTYFPETQGGGQEVIRQFCLATSSRGVENTVFALAKEPDPKDLDLPEAHLRRSKSHFEIASCDFGGIDALLSCRRMASRADILQIYYPWPFADAMLPFVRQGKPVIVTYISDIVRQRRLDAAYAPLRRYLLGSADAITVTSPAFANSSPVLRSYSEKLRIVPYCLGEASPPDSGRADHWERQLGKGFFLFVGVLRYYKGLEFLIRGASRTKHAIVIVGDGPERSRLESMACTLGASNVAFLGALPDIDKHALYSLCRAVVLPSHQRSEAFGMTLLEAARAGKPMISCEIGTDTSWVNLDGETGLVVPPSDADALTHALNALAGNESLCQRFGLAASMRWRTHYSTQVVGEKLRSLYETLTRRDQAA